MKPVGQVGMARGVRVQCDSRLKLQGAKMLFSTVPSIAFLHLHLNQERKP
jgi:hypothetical protein